MDGQDKPTDWLAFQGASYFRSSGQDAQYGASARGIAINTALPRRRNFPASRNSGWNRTVRSTTIYALLDGPTVTGAYKFDSMKNAAGNKAATMRDECALRAFLPRRHFAPGRRAADQHVLVWRE